MYLNQIIWRIAMFVFKTEFRDIKNEMEKMRMGKTEVSVNPWLKDKRR